jgi:hypothetical protein
MKIKILIFLSLIFNLNGLNYYKNFEIKRVATISCQLFPCLNKGLCLSLDQKEFKCFCLPMYYGNRCEKSKKFIQIFNQILNLFVFISKLLKKKMQSSFR